MHKKQLFIEKSKEAVASVLPITLIVAALCLLFIPVDTDLMLAFIIGSLMLIAGMVLFSVGSDTSMSQIGAHMGARMTKSRKLWLIVAVSFLLGTFITTSEPDLTVLATNVPHIDTTVLIITVSVGVGLCLVLCMLRILFAIPLNRLLLILYGVLFLLSVFIGGDFLSVAFDSGGVTTGPMTVPFIMALGVGVASIRSDEHAQQDSFGLVALCSVGPILAVMLLSFFYHGSPESSEYALMQSHAHTVELGHEYMHALPEYIKEVAAALLPIIAFFFIFQVISLRLPGKSLLRIIVGLIYTCVGLMLFLTGANVGFSALGYVLGGKIIASPYRFILIPLAMVMGWFIINAEPAVHVLTKQVEELSSGTISEKAMQLSLSVAVAAAMGMSMLRVLTGISIMWFVLPGYAVALALSFIVPPTFTAIAFDSGGVASGPLTATFMLPFAMGACSAVGGNVMSDAFGLVALVAMMPLITVQVMGAVSTFKSRAAAPAETMGAYGDYDVIELWEV
ncbi:MAG: DUF1538 domain-containing protein [Clostridia bacterium]|nr:DUF1538 domain-containing protein [Clostridia bacterium]